MGMERPTDELKTLLSVETVQKISAHAAEFPSPNHYVNRLEKLYADKAVYGGWLRVLAPLVEPVDDRTYRDPTMRSYEAFRKGGLIGIKVLDLVGGNRLMDEVSRTRLAGHAAQSTSKEEANQTIDWMMATADASYDIAQAYHPLMEQLGNAIVPDLRYQRYWERGFGFVVYAATVALEHPNEPSAETVDAEHARQEFTAMVERADEIPWDDLLD